MVVNDNKLWEKWDNDKETREVKKKDRGHQETIDKHMVKQQVTMKQLHATSGCGTMGSMRNGESKQGMANLVMEE